MDDGTAMSYLERHHPGFVLGLLVLCTMIEQEGQ